MLWETVIRFVIGGVAVSIFALAGGVFKPKSFAGLFGAAPSVALATLGLGLAKNGPSYVSIECRSMIFGGLALGLYSLTVSWLLMRQGVSALTATLSALPLWFATAFGLWYACSR